MRVAVLGSGPAGLFAAEACKADGHEVRIFSRDLKPSPMSGSQYLHQAIPGLTSEEPSGSVHFWKVGTRYGYAEKVYGDPDAPCSWDLFPTGELPCWNLKNVYLKLFKSWYGSISTVEIDKKFLDYLEQKRDIFQMVISAIPCPVICENSSHRFESARVWFESHQHKDSQLGENYIYYSGDPRDSWYRSSYIFGSGWWEFGSHTMTGQTEQRVLRNISTKVFEGKKPLDTNCDCRPRMIRVGRFGEWKKGILTHHAFLKTIDALEVFSQCSALNVPNK